jgi:hypothetical protein
MTRTQHPACEVFPMIGGDEFEALKRDIAANGQREPIVLVDGELVDGRNRLRACEELGIEPVFRNLPSEEAGDVFALVMSLNLHRRHLKPRERGAALRAYMKSIGAKRQQGKRVDKANGSTSPSVSEVAATLGVPRQTASRHIKAAEDYEAASPDLRAKVDAGELTPKKARQLTENPDAEPAEPKPRTGKRAKIIENFARNQAAEFVGRIEGVAGYCEKVKVEAIRSDERLLRHWREASKSAINALRSLLKKLED